MMMKCFVLTISSVPLLNSWTLTAQLEKLPIVMTIKILKARAVAEVIYSIGSSKSWEESKNLGTETNATVIGLL